MPEIGQRRLASGIIGGTRTEFGLNRSANNQQLQDIDGVRDNVDFDLFKPFQQGHFESDEKVSVLWVSATSTTSRSDSSS
jgi:hypothetical protein